MPGSGELTYLSYRTTSSYCNASWFDDVTTFFLLICCIKSKNYSLKKE